MASIDNTQPAPTLLPSQGGNPADFGLKVQRYTAEQLDGRTVAQLSKLLFIADYDIRSDTSVYSGLTRTETVATARQTFADVIDALHGRAMADDVEYCHTQALEDYTIGRSIFPA